MLMWSIMRSEIEPVRRLCPVDIDPEHVRPHGSVGARNMNPDQEVCMELDKEACFAYLDEIAANVQANEAPVSLDDARFVSSKFSLSVKTAELVVREWVQEHDAIVNAKSPLGKAFAEYLTSLLTVGSVSIAFTLNHCRQCAHIDHSGAFTKGGARTICGHDCATETLEKLDALASKKSFKQAYPEYAGDARDNESWRHHWFHRIVDADGEVVGWCPLKHGARY